MGRKTLLFLLSNGPQITTEMFVKNKWLSHIGVNPDNYSGHSLRIGCAMLAGQLGFTPNEIKDLGKWSSDAYMTYIQTPLNYSANYATRLLSQTISKYSLRMWQSIQVVSQ